MAEEKRIAKTLHNVIMENRSKLNISGIIDVESFDDQTINLLMQDGGLSVRGEQLRIGSFSVETGEIAVEGYIFALVYSEGAASKGGLFSRLFK